MIRKLNTDKSFVMLSLCQFPTEKGFKHTKKPELICGESKY